MAPFFIDFPVILSTIRYTNYDSVAVILNHIIIQKRCITFKKVFISVNLHKKTGTQN